MKKTKLKVSIPVILFTGLWTIAAMTLLIITIILGINKKDKPIFAYIAIGFILIFGLVLFIQSLSALIIKKKLFNGQKSFGLVKKLTIKKDYVTSYYATIECNNISCEVLLSSDDFNKLKENEKTPILIYKNYIYPNFNYVLEKDIEIKKDAYKPIDNYCRKCGEFLPSNHSFCRKCGSTRN